MTSGVVVQRLTGAHAPEVALHLLRLPEADRRLRFGAPIRDSTIEGYAQGIDFSRDKVFGILGADLELLGVAHLALDPTGQTAELGLSVDRAARGKGYGYALLQRAVLHATNLGYRALFMHCLTENHVMMHLARKAGLTLVVEAGEADGRLELRERTQAGALQEAIEDQFALVDSLLKQQYAWLGRARHGRTEQAA
ncbi:MAG TPA: GNAT family N-acetyltransferase [Burkholderiales bacterium]|nr:GNAT family N-acetyltransferase [Burkholderiales bacterium]